MENVPQSNCSRKLNEVTRRDVMLLNERPLLFYDLVDSVVSVEGSLDVRERDDGAIGSASTKISGIVIQDKSFEREVVSYPN